MGGGMATATSSTLSVGTLGFDVYDPAAKQLLWRGSATKTLNPPKDPDKRQKNLDKSVAKLLKNFPPIFETHDQAAKSPNQTEPRPTGGEPSLIVACLGS